MVAKGGAITDEQRRWPLADVEVELTLLPTEHGGRRSPAGQGYRPQFYYGNEDCDALYEYAIDEEIPPGKLVRARLTFLRPEHHLGRVFMGMPFLLREGSRVVGYGRVIALMDFEPVFGACSSQRPSG
jgi:translation elongation factor EF-Tu-like GTPase